MGGINILYAKDNESWLSCIVKYKQTVSTLTSFFTCPTSTCWASQINANKTAFQVMLCTWRPHRYKMSAHSKIWSCNNFLALIQILSSKSLLRVASYRGSTFETKLISEYFYLLPSRLNFCPCLPHSIGTQKDETLYWLIDCLTSL